MQNKMNLKKVESSRAKKVRTERNRVKSGGQSKAEHTEQNSP